MRPLVWEGEEVNNYQSDVRVAKGFIGNAKKWVLNTQVGHGAARSEQQRRRCGQIGGWVCSSKLPRWSKAVGAGLKARSRKANMTLFGSFG